MAAKKTTTKKMRAKKTPDQCHEEIATALESMGTIIPHIMNVIVDKLNDVSTIYKATDMLNRCLDAVERWQRIDRAHREKRDGTEANGTVLAIMAGVDVSKMTNGKD